MKLLTTIAVIWCILNTTGCLKVPENNLPLYQRSVAIKNVEDEERILSKAKLNLIDDPYLNNIRVLYLKGTPYEMGFQHGRLLKDDVNKCVKHVMKKAIYYAEKDIMDEAYDLMSPYIPVEEKEEMRGLAHGAGLPLRVVHWFHAIPEVSEYGGRKKFRKNFKGTSCSNIIAFGKATIDSKMYQLRVLDWNRRLGVQNWPVIIVHKPDSGIASATFSYAGFIGCVSGMNEKKITLGEMGFGDPPGETLEGIPFVFLFRKILREASTLSDAEDLIKNAHRTCSYIFAASDCKIAPPLVNAKLFITNRYLVETYTENTDILDKRNGRLLPAYHHVLYAGPRKTDIAKSISKYYGKISWDAMINIAKEVSLRGNIQNVIYKPDSLEALVSNAVNPSKDIQGKACNQKWFYFNFKKALEN